MNMQDDLQQAVDVATVALLEHPQHQLLPIYRKAIYEVLDAASAPQGIGGRARLALLAAQRVQPIWQSVWPNDPLISRLWRVAQDVVSNYIPQHLGWYEAEWGMKTIDGLGAQRIPKEQLFAFFAGEAVVCALYEISGMRGFDYVTIEEQTRDGELDVESSDTAKWAAIASAGGSIRLPLDIEKSRAFWDWWLRIAVPSAGQPDQPTPRSYSE